MKILPRQCFAALLICAVWTDAQAKQAPSASSIFGWKSTYAKDGLHLSQPDYPRTSVRIVIDRRANVAAATSFEEAKAYFSRQSGCVGLKNAQTKRDYGYAAVIAGINNKAVDRNKLPVHEYEAWDSKDIPRCVLIAQKYQGGGLQIAVIVDDGRIFKRRRIEIKEVLTEHFKQQNSAAFKAEQAQVHESKTTNLPCKGAKSYKDWTVTWSPKDSRVYAKAAELVDNPAYGSVFVSFRMKHMEKTDKNRRKEIDRNDYFILVSAKGTGKDARMIVPVKQKLIIDGNDLYDWTRETQWSPLSADVVTALENGQTADIVLQDIGRVRFPLPGLSWMLKWGEVQFSKAKIRTRLGKCKP